MSPSVTESSEFRPLNRLHHSHHTTTVLSWSSLLCQLHSTNDPGSVRQCPVSTCVSGTQQPAFMSTPGWSSIPSDSRPPTASKNSSQSPALCKERRRLLSFFYIEPRKTRLFTMKAMLADDVRESIPCCHLERRGNRRNTWQGDEHKSYSDPDQEVSHCWRSVEARPGISITDRRPPGLGQHDILANVDDRVL